MEKLLHERLREWAKHDSERSLYPVNKAAREFGIKSTGAAEEGELFEKFADEIEHYYIPRPRFEDGEPVPWGAIDLAWSNGKPYAFNALDECGVPIAKCLHEIYAYADMSSDGFVERPTPKVCDADGVEIKVGDTVWLTLQDTPGDDKEFTVFSIGNAGEVIVAPKGGINRSYSATLLTHERPVFDAEGVRICKGDTVWHANHQWIVVGIVYHEGKPWVQIDNTDGKASAQERQPFDITHREPDSIQKVVDDMDASLRGMKVCDLQGYIDRLTALIERDA